MLYAKCNSTDTSVHIYSGDQCQGNTTEALTSKSSNCTFFREMDKPIEVNIWGTV